MKRRSRLLGLYLPAALLLVAGSRAAFAGPQTQAGPYHIEVTSEPGIISLGKAKLLLKITDAAGKPVEGAAVRALTKMPGMDMGEREQPAVPQTRQPGVYVAAARFAMEGGYTSTLRISGPRGAATATISLSTGQDTSAGAGGFSFLALLPYLLGLTLMAAFVLYRMRRTGQRFSGRAIFNLPVLAGLLLLALMLLGANYAVRHFRRPGAMTPLEVQGMQMQTPAPPGTTPVELASVTRGPIESTVRYTGQAVGYVEQEVYPRTTGAITWMPFYAGSPVKRGQVLVRLDTSQSGPQAAQSRAALTLAEQGTGVARAEYRQALAGIQEAEAELAGKTGALTAARADLAGIREGRTNAAADQRAAESQVIDAAAQKEAARADQQYWTDEIARMRKLLAAGAVSREEFQREQAQAASADAKVRQTEAHETQVRAQVQAARSMVRKADAGVAAASAKVVEAGSELHAHHGHVASMKAAAAAARQRIGQAQTAAAGARAALAGAAATQGYAEIRSQVDGVVTQRLISPGVLVSPGQAILKVAQIQPIRLQANVAEADLARIRVGAPVTVRGQSSTGAVTAARVTSVAPAVDPAARTGIVEALVSNADRRFLPGQYVAMEISTGRSPSSLKVLTRAVLSTESSPYVWVAAPATGQDNQFTVRRVNVQTGLTNGASTEIRSGLEEGQQVVISSQQYLRDGDAVASARQTTPAPPARTAGVRYTCPMHPEVVQDKPGKCPKCGMELVPKKGAAR